MNSYLGIKTQGRSNGGRAIIATLAATLFAGIAVLGGCTPSAGLIGGACSVGFLECGGACVVIAEDHDNCGGCGHVCAGSTQCSAGVCEAVQTASAVTSCAADNALCAEDGACRDLQHDPSHCGACGTRCAAGDICNAGTCAKLEPGLRDCTPDNVRCGEACRDVRFDPSNCGACGGHCAATDRCTDGICVPAVGCAEGSVVCAGKCSNPQNDKANCGACGAACAMGEICSDGECKEVTHCSLMQ